jgi:hypothetical protein
MLETNQLPRVHEMFVCNAEPQETVAVVRELVVTVLHPTIHNNVLTIPSTPRHQPPRQSHSPHWGMLYKIIYTNYKSIHP